MSKLTGPEHFEWAEALLESAVRQESQADALALIAEAGVHASLAVAAAVAAPRMQWQPVPDHPNRDAFEYPLDGWEEITRREPSNTEEK